MVMGLDDQSGVTASELIAHFLACTVSIRIEDPTPREFSPHKQEFTASGGDQAARRHVILA